MNRNQFMLIGMVLLLLGLHLRFVDTFVLSEDSTRFLARRTSRAESKKPWDLPFTLAAKGTVPITRQRIQPPRWLAYAFISVGAVMVLHSLVMRKPDG